MRGLDSLLGDSGLQMSDQRTRTGMAKLRNRQGDPAVFGPPHRRLRGQGGRDTHLHRIDDFVAQMLAEQIFQRPDIVDTEDDQRMRPGARVSFPAIPAKYHLPAHATLSGILPIFTDAGFTDAGAALTNVLQMFLTNR
jgi:hypothetical protein